MKISKTKAIQLIDEKISQFENGRTLYKLIGNEPYQVAYYGTLNLLTELFSKEEMIKFWEIVNASANLITKETDSTKASYLFSLHIESCIAQLKVYKEKIQNFWPDEIEIVSHAKPVSYSKILPFISISFDDTDKEVNEYVTAILKALQIDFVTGERYSRDSIPQKIRNRIRDSGLFISIFVKRDKIEGGGYTTPSWLLKELGIAQGTGKDVIAWVEKGIKDIAGLNYEKEVIYFERRDIKEMQKATIKFLEALCEHGLI